MCNSYADCLRKGFIYSQSLKFKRIVENRYPICLIQDFVTFARKEKFLDVLLEKLENDENFQNEFNMVKDKLLLV